MVVPVIAEGVIEPPNGKTVTAERKTESGHLNKDFGSASIEPGTSKDDGHMDVMHLASIFLMVAPPNMQSVGQIKGSQGVRVRTGWSSKILSIKNCKTQMYKRYSRALDEKAPSEKDLTLSEYYEWLNRATAARDQFVKGNLSQEEALSIINVP